MIEIRIPGKSRAFWAFLTLDLILVAAIVGIVVTGVPTHDWRRMDIDFLIAHADPLAEVPALREQNHPLDTFAGRPVFHASRHPFSKPEAAATAPPVAMELNRLSLVGTLIFGDRGRIALIRQEGEDDLITASFGQTVEDWTIVEISPRSILLERNGEERGLDLLTFGDLQMEGDGPAEKTQRSARTFSTRP